MPLTPDWAPNIHPLIVHFPIALLASAAVVDALGLLAPGRPAVRDAATWLYLAGASFALVAYLSGEAGANSLLVPAEVNPLLNAHADWAFRTTWFFAFFASFRLAVSFILRPRRALTLASVLMAAAGLVLLAETAEHGGRLVYQHGLGVRAITTDAPITDAVTDRREAAAPRDAGIVVLDADAGSWRWRPARGAPAALDAHFSWLSGGVDALAPAMVDDPDRGQVLALRAPGAPALFVGGPALESTQVEVSADIDALDGTLRIAYHVASANTFDFFEVGDHGVRLGRVEAGTVTVFEDAPLDAEGWLLIRVFGGDGHFRGYVNGELVAHGHAHDLEAGPAGLQIEGSGSVRLEQIDVQAVP